MEEMERDVVVFTDDEGNEIELDVIDYFEHEGQEYAVLTDLSEDEDDADADADADVEQDVYIFKLVVNEEDDTEEFLPADDELMETLSAIVEERLSEACECECGCGGDCEDEGGCGGCQGHGE